MQKIKILTFPEDLLLYLKMQDNSNTQKKQYTILVSAMVHLWIKILFKA